MLPPKANADNGNISKAVQKSLCYYYKYDGLKRMILKRLPGVWSVNMIYDKKDRLVLSQDGEQSKSNTWLYSKYDKFNRVIETGICSSTKSAVNLRSEAFVSSDYTPTNIVKKLTETYYDNYNFDGISSSVPAGVTSCATGFFIDVKGLVTGTKVRVLGVSDEQWITTTNYYDNKYRLIQSIKNLYPSGKSIVSNVYDFVGNVLRTKEFKSAYGQSKMIDTHFDYDYRGRLLTVKQGVNNGSLQTLASMTYNEIGQLNKKTLHGNASLYMEYAYNIRGWLKSIDGSKFDMNLYYQDAKNNIGGLTGENLYNGNISAMTWTNYGESKQGYAFSYDGISRLKGADYGVGSTLVDRNYYDVDGITYDENGNILSLNRKENGVMIDKLLYRYFSAYSNKLKGVGDYANSTTNGDASRGFKNGSGVDTEYIYDYNGNIIKDLNKGISSIEYNVLNLPEKIVFADGKEIKYVYSASGEKLQNVVNGKTLTYCGF